MIHRFALIVCAIFVFACAQRSAPSQPFERSPLPTPAAPNAILFEAFYWNTPLTTPAGSWWLNLAAKAPELAAAGISAVWLPPPYKAYSADRSGYAVYDRYDLGEFDQQGGVATHFGTLEELETAIAAFHSAGIQVYGDMVMNHMLGADHVEWFVAGWRLHKELTGFAFPGRGDKYSTFRWGHDSFNGVQPEAGRWIQWHAWDFTPYAAGDAYDHLLGCEIRYADARQRQEMIAWGKWITQKLALDGYRLDATKHILTSFINEWLDAMKSRERFTVSEAWFRDLQALREYARATGGRTHLFDVPLQTLFAAMSQGNGRFDMRLLAGGGLTATDGALAVSFVDNHDTDQEDGPLAFPVKRFKLHAYAYILTRAAGTPTIFYRDYYEYGLGPALKKLIALRKAHAFGPAFEHPEADDEDLYAYSRAGDGAHTGLLLLLHDGDRARTKRLRTPFPYAELHEETGAPTQVVKTDALGVGVFPLAPRAYAVWVPK